MNEVKTSSLSAEQQFPYAVVTTYSFDDDVETFLCTSMDEAKSVLKKIFDGEIELDNESGHDFTSEISDDGDIAKIINYRENGDVDETTWRIAHTNNGPKILK